MDRATDAVEGGRSSSQVGAGDITRIREWMDRPDWDVLDDASELKQDKAECLQLLAQAPAGKHVMGTAKQRFTNARFLGAGAFGIVFSVRDELLGLGVAIKLLRPSKSNSLELQARFVGEAQSTAALSHASIVRVFDTGQLGGLPYFTCSLFESGTLADRISKKGSALSIRQSAWVMSKVADSVEFAHVKAILHRDLKPSNILLKPSELEDTEQFGFEPILTDFGLAKRLDETEAGKNLTCEGRVLGTARYMSPEQARGALSEIGTTSDVFSLGTILYQLLVGQVPFDDLLDQNVRFKIANTDPIAPRRIDPTVPKDLEAVVLKCLAKSPSERYPSARELRLDLERFLRGEPVEAKRSTLFRRGSYAVRKHPMVASLLAGAVAANCIAVVGLSAALQRAEAAREVERVAKITVISAKDREQIALAEIVSIYSDLADKVFAGSRVKDDVMLASLGQSIKIVEGFVRENPKNDRILHCLSVLKHYESIAYQRFGKPENYIASRESVLRILDRLLERHPGNERYRHQRFHSQLILAEWMVSSTKIKSTYTSLNGVELLQTAHAEIESLVRDFPSNISYQDAFASSKLHFALIVPHSADVRRRMICETVDHSEQLWRQFPDQPLLAKHAIRGLSILAKDELDQFNSEQAYTLWMRADALYTEAWKPSQDELWVTQERTPLLELEIDVLVDNNRFKDALIAIEELEHNYMVLLDAANFKTYILRSIFYSGLKRISIASLSCDYELDKKSRSRLVEFVLSHRNVAGFLKDLRGISTRDWIPSEVEMLLVEEGVGDASK